MGGAGEGGGVHTTQHTCDQGQAGGGNRPGGLVAVGCSSCCLCLLVCMGSRQRRQQRLRQVWLQQLRRRRRSGSCTGRVEPTVVPSVNHCGSSSSGSGKGRSSLGRLICQELGFGGGVRFSRPTPPTTSLPPLPTPPLCSYVVSELVKIFGDQPGYDASLSTILSGLLTESCSTLRTLQVQGGAGCRV